MVDLIDRVDMLLAGNGMLCIMDSRCAGAGTIDGPEVETRFYIAHLTS